MRHLIRTMSGPPSFEPLDDRPWDGAKRKIILALLATSSLAVLGAGSAEAVRTRYPFCMGGDVSRPEQLQLHELSAVPGDSIG